MKAGLERIPQTAPATPRGRFTVLAHHLTVESLDGLCSRAVREVYVTAVAPHRRDPERGSRPAFLLAVADLQSCPSRRLRWAPANMLTSPAPVLEQLQPDPPRYQTANELWRTERIIDPCAWDAPE